MRRVAIIASDYVRSKRFYAETLGLAVIAEQYRADRPARTLKKAS